MLVHTGRCIQLIQIAELKDSFLFVFDLSIKIKPDLKAWIEHFIFMRHEYEPEIVVSFIERNQFIEIFVAECMTE